MSKEIDDLVAEHIMEGRPGFYSTDIAAAWEVVEVIDKEGLYIELDQHEGKCGVLIQDIVGNDPGEGNAETMPMAICLAILRYKKVKI
jgi:hypothetical protein